MSIEIKSAGISRDGDGNYTMSFDTTLGFLHKPFPSRISHGNEPINQIKRRIFLENFCRMDLKHCCMKEHELKRLSRHIKRARLENDFQQWIIDES